MSDAAASAPAVEPGISPVAAVVGTFSSPSETFRRLVARPTWWLPFVLGILATAAICLVSQVWAMLVTGPWYLATFLIFGAGELIGVYCPNYIVSSSRTSDLRRNMGFVTMLMVPAAPAGYLYGAIVDFVKGHKLTAFGLTSESLGFRLSFLASGLFILSGIVVAVTLLPKQPRAPAD